ncbi:MAG TPA: DUF4255 domain-containing protein [Allosphingosinicella sp.]|jgi:hypothetical protein
MADSLAVAAVTFILADLLGEAAGALPGTRVTTLSPSADDILDSGEPTINLWLLAASPDAALRNAPPAGGESGGVSARGALPLSLSYLISCHGNEARLEPHVLLGAVAATLHGHPLLDRDLIARAIAGDVRFGAFAFASARGPIAIRLLAADSETIGRAWLGIPGARRRLSLLCAAGPVTVAPSPPAVLARPA